MTLQPESTVALSPDSNFADSAWDQSAKMLPTLAALFSESGLLQIGQVLGDGLLAYCELLARAISARDRVVQREGLGPKDQVATTKQALERTGGDVMIVGHLPFLGKLAALLVTGSEANEIVEFQYGGVVCIERRHEGKWKIAWMITPALLHG
jgi:hypothetical protein